MSNYEWNAFKQKVTDYLTLNEIEFAKDDVWIIGVSGGADSMALLHVLAKKKKKMIVVHVNYKKRGKESDKDEQFVKKWAEKYDLPFFVKDGTITESGNFQELARLLRYSFFQEIKEQYRASYIVTAHHLDDYSENSLFRTLRGSSPETILSRNTTQSQLLRPFAKIRSTEIRKALLESGFDWREDQSNSESNFTRNWLRNDVIPELNERIPGWNQHLVEKATLEFELIQELSKVYRNEIFVEANEICIHVPLLGKLSHRIIKALLFKKLIELNWKVSSSALDEVSELVSTQKGKMIQLGKNLFALRSSAKILIFKKEMALEQFAVIESIKKNEPVQLLGLGFDFKVISRAEIDRLSRRDQFFLDLAKIIFPVKIRYWQQGDRIRPFGMHVGSKLISDSITESKIDLHQKNEVVVIEDGSKTCIAISFPKGFELFNRIADFVKVDEKTQEVLHITSMAN